MVVLWSILLTVGLVVAIWYLSSILSPYGRIHWPRLLWKGIGHYISWLLTIVGIIALFGLYTATHNLTLFLRILGSVILLVVIVKIKLTPMEMPFNDVKGSLYSGGGLRFGGFQTSQFLDVTEPLETKLPGIREKVVGEAHYLAFWLHKFPEIAFFFGIILYKSLWIAFLFFIGAFILEIIRFYIFGSSLFLSHLCRFWNWAEIPAFIIAAIALWPEENSLSIILLGFLVIQGWFDLVASVGMLPIRLVIGRLIYKKYGRHWHNMEGMTISFVINRWRLKLFPADRFKIDKKSS
jgi:hypothetical protein